MAWGGYVGAHFDPRQIRPNGAGERAGVAYLDVDARENGCHCDSCAIAHQGLNTPA